MSEAGHVKRIKIPEVFLQESKPIASTAAPNTPILPYLAMEEYQKQRESEIRESVFAINARRNDREDEALVGRSPNPPMKEAATTHSGSSTPLEEATGPGEASVSEIPDENEPNHFVARTYISEPIASSDRPNTSAPRPDPTQALAASQGSARSKVSNETIPSPKPSKRILPKKPLDHDPGDIYINEEGQRVRLVRKVRPPKNRDADATLTSVKEEASDAKPRARRKKPRKNIQRSPGGKCNSTKNTGKGTQDNGTKNPRRRRANTTDSAEYPRSIGIPTDSEERSVQSELNMLSLGEMTPTEIAKMDPPSETFSRVTLSTPGSKDSETARTSASSTPPSFAGKRQLFPNDRNDISLASETCGCVII